MPGNSAWLMEIFTMIMEEVESFEALRRRWRDFTFARVTRVVVDDENVTSFVDKDRCTAWPDEPWFSEKRAEFTPSEWARTERHASYYYGFAQIRTGEEIHFSSKEHYGNIYGQPMDPLLLGYADSWPNIVPVEGQWVVGELHHTRRNHFFRWCTSTEQAECFITMALSGKTTFGLKELRRRLEFPPEGMELMSDRANDELVDMTKLFVCRDFGYFLERRQAEGREQVDLTVHTLCGAYGEAGLWEQYATAVRHQPIDAAKRFSSVIPDLAPTDKSTINRPFAALDSMAFSR